MGWRVQASGFRVGLACLGFRDCKGCLGFLGFRALKVPRGLQLDKGPKWDYWDPGW